MNHPTLSVLDTTDPEAVVVWHVQTDPAAPAGPATGAWILGPGEAQGPGRLGDLLHGTVVVPTAGSAVPDGAAHTDLTRVRRGVEKRLSEYKGHGVTLPDIRDVATEQEFLGEPQAERAWRAAMELVALVSDWHQIESTRRSRKALAEAFGAEVQPLPLGEPAD